MTSLPQPYGDDQGIQHDALLLAAKDELARRAEDKREARRAVRRARRARRAHLRRIRRDRRAEMARRVVAKVIDWSPAGCVGAGAVVFVVSVVMFVKGDDRAAEMFSAAVGLWALAVALVSLRRQK
ncbi:hypothetical protein ACUXZZ_12775 [Streptomyces graminifolii]|jgi:hypothetical protein|uniref:hypothetical protein n=1 Tax=Streptomyces graminifolii TaxID=1266771 RepID=UPI004057FF1F